MGAWGRTGGARPSSAKGGRAMSGYVTLAAIYNLAYPALDAVVADLVENIAFTTSDGEPVPLTVQWKQLSAGSSEHQVTDETGREMIRVRVRLLPEEERVVSVVNFQTAVPEIGPLLSQLAENLQKVIGQHRTNLRHLEEQGYAQRPIPNAPQPDVPTRVEAPARRPGRHADPVNAWARQQLALGAPREQVFREWAKRKSLDISTEENDDRARAAFRKAIQRKR